MKLLTRAAGALALACGVTGCPDARVEQFDASLHYICPGQRVVLTWRVSGSATMDSVPEGGGIATGPVEGQGQITFAPLQTTSVKLHVTRCGGNPTTSTQEVRVRGDASTPLPIGASLSSLTTVCSGRKLSLTAKATGFDPALTVASVAELPAERHTLLVVHGVTADTLAPGAVSTKFKGAPVAGDWQITADLLPGEACGSPTLPSNLAINVITQCDPGASK